GKKLLSKQVDNPRGSFEFTVPADGAYRACISQVKQKTGPLVQKSKPWRFGLDLVYGHNDAYYDQLQERLKIGELEVSHLLCFAKSAAGSQFVAVPLILFLTLSRSCCSSCRTGHWTY
ncbi:unnamed protein product, partial [Chrysoparadoxa australica]